MASLSVPEWCIGALQRSIRDLEHHCHGTSLHPHVHVLDAQQIQLEQVFREVIAAEVVYGSSHASLTFIRVYTYNCTSHLTIIILMRYNYYSFAYILSSISIIFFILSSAYILLEAARTSFSCSY